MDKSGISDRVSSDQSSSEEPGSQTQLRWQQSRRPSLGVSHLGRKLILTLLPGLLRIPNKIMAGTVVGAHRGGLLSALISSVLFLKAHRM